MGRENQHQTWINAIEWDNSGAKLHARVGGPWPRPPQKKFLKFFFYYVENFNILIINPQKGDLTPSTIWVGPIIFFKKLSNLSGGYWEHIVSQIYFLW